MRFIAVAICTLLLGLAGQALAAGTATLSAGRSAGTVRIAWLTPATVRIDPQSEPAYMLVRDGRMYSVINGGGRVMVMDLSQMAGMMPPDVGLPQNLDAYDAAKITAMKPTGGHETVAGIKGDVYRITWQDGDGQPHVDNAVLSDDPRVLELTHALLGAAVVMAKATGHMDPKAISHELEDRKLGMLRFGNRVEVTEISADAPASSEFELPAPPIKLPGIFQQGRN